MLVSFIIPSPADKFDIVKGVTVKNVTESLNV